MELTQIIIEPLITEKTGMAGMQNRYVFKVAEAANKIDVKHAVEKLFNVKVLSVNTVKVSSRKRGTGRTQGSTSSYKKAYVKLAPGQKIAQMEAQG